MKSAFITFLIVLSLLLAIWAASDVKPAAETDYFKRVAGSAK